MARTRVQVRLYAAGGPSEGRVIPPKQVKGATWRVTRLSGYADGALELSGLPSEHPGLASDAKVEFWGWDDAGQAYLRLYRGYVLQAIGQGRTAAAPRKTSVTLYGLWDRLARQVALQRYLWATPPDLASIFTGLLSRWAPVALVGSYTTSTTTTGVVLDALDAYKIPLSAAIERLDGAAAHQLVAGCDVDGSGGNRAYLRPFDTSPSLVAALPDPSNHIELIESGEDARQRANVLYLRGGKARYANLFASLTRSQDGATGTGNTSFENPRLGGGGYGNLITSGGFENLLVDWTTSGGPTAKDTSDPEGPAYEGVKLLEIDNNSGPESVSQSVTTGIVAGATYTLDFVAKAETSAGTPPEGLVTIEWKNSGVGISTDSLTYGGSASPIPATWTGYRVPFVAPATANEMQITLSASVASVNFGIHLDAVQLFRSDTLYQEGWETASGSGGVFGRVDWAITAPTNPAGAARLPFHGAYCVLIEILAASVGQECYLRPRAEATVAVQGGNAYRFSKRSLSPSGATLTPPRKLVIVELEADGTTVIGTFEHDLPAVAAFTDWTQETFYRTMSQNCRYVRCWEEYVGAGKLYSDAFQIRDANSVQTEFVEGEDFEAIYRADDTALGLSSPTADSIADLGQWPEISQQEAITSESDGQAWASAALLERAISQLRPRVVWVGSPTLPGSAAPPWPGRVIKGMGDIGAAILTTPQPIAEISGEWAPDKGNMLLRMTASLTTDPETEARILQRLFRKIRLVGR